MTAPRREVKIWVGRSEMMDLFATASGGEVDAWAGCRRRRRVKGADVAARSMKRQERRVVGRME